MANSTSRSRLAAVCLYLGFGKGGRRWISLHDRLARHESAMTANTLCSDTSHIPDWPCRFQYVFETLFLSNGRSEAGKHFYENPVYQALRFVFVASATTVE